MICIINNTFTAINRMKRIILWYIQSYIYLIPLVLILAGVYLFARFIPDYFGVLSFVWVVIVSFFYIKYNRWY